MKRHWEEQELAERWSLTHDEFELVRNRTDRGRIGFAALLKFFQLEARFPTECREVPRVALEHLAGQLEVSREAFDEYEFTGRSWERDRGQIRELLGFRQATVDDGSELTAWLQAEVVPVELGAEHLREAALDWLRKKCVEPPTPERLERIVASASNTFEKDFFAATLGRIPSPCRAALDNLLVASGDEESVSEIERTPMAELRADPGRPSLESVLKEISKLQRIDAVDLPDGVFDTTPAKLLQRYRLRAATEPPRELRRHPDAIRYTLLAAFCWQRRKETIDGLVDLFIQVVHRIGTRSERKVVKVY